jgi:hypothetical protein
LLVKKLKLSLKNKKKRKKFNSTSRTEKMKYAFVVAGQSNACGANGPTMRDLCPDIAGPEAPVRGCFMLSHGIGTSSYLAVPEGDFQEMENPVQNPVMVQMSTSFAFHFAVQAKLCLSDTDEVYIIGCAMPDSSFCEKKENYRSQWKKPDVAFPNGGSMYEMTVRSVLAATSTHGLTLAGFLWHQGESDGSNPYYASDLESMIFSMRSSLKDPRLPFIIGLMSTDSQIKHPTVHLAHATMRARMDSMYGDMESAVGIVDMDDISSSVCYDGVHFTRDACRVIGKRYLDAFRLLPSCISFQRNSETEQTERVHTETLSKHYFCAAVSLLSAFVFIISGFAVWTSLSSKK